MQLLVSELVANGLHRTDEPDKAVLLQVDTDSRSIHAAIVHLGTGEAIRATPDEAERAGWDVMLLEELSSRWGVIEGSNEGVWFEIDRWA